MEIQNTQIGQVFASITPLGRESADMIEPADGDEEKQLRDQRSQGERSASREISGDEGGNSQILTQASSLPADNVIVERESVQLEEAVAQVETFLKAQNRDLAFSIDDSTQRSIVTVKDSQSGDVIRQIPSEDVLKLAERIQELQQDVGKSVGVFINNQV